MLGGIAAGLFCAFLAFVFVADNAIRYDRRARRKLRRARRTPIAQAREGSVIKIVGELGYAGAPVTSPLTGRACSYYHIVVEEVSSTKSRNSIPMIVESRGVDFFLRDETGVALVRIADRGAHPLLSMDFQTRSTRVLHADADLERYLRERYRAVEGKNLRAAEGTLKAGERVAVRGMARWEPDPDGAGGSYRDTAMRLVLESSEELPLDLSNDPSVAR